MTEIRTTSATGGLKGVKPERYSFIPKAPLDLLARIYGYGHEKYGDAHNYRKGYEWSKNYDALQRHLTAWWDREDNDPESGLSHLGHAAWHIFSLIVFSSDPKYKQYDDRYGDDINLNESKILISDGLLTREEAYGTEGAAVVDKLLGCVWIETLTPDGRAWVCQDHNWMTRRAPATGESCGASHINEHAICYYEDATHPVSHVCLEHGQTSKYGVSEGPNRACQAVDPWVRLESVMDTSNVRLTHADLGIELLDPIESERPFVHPNGQEVACEYTYLTPEKGSASDGYYWCKVHESRTQRHPIAGANRPCNYIDPTNGDWGNVIPPAAGK